MGRKYNDLTNMRFGRLVVKKRGSDRIKKGGSRVITWICDCDCGNIDLQIDGLNLIKGDTKSCGCLRTELKKAPRKKKGNKYDLSGEYGIGYDSNNKEFYFDLEDYDLIKNYTWRINSNGYVEAWKGNLMHRKILNPSKDKVVDHIGGKNTRNDNRKSNLRITTYSKNAMNHNINKKNTSGVTGVHYDKTDKVWVAKICVNKKTIQLGCYKKFEDAVAARKQAEDIYFGKYSYVNSQITYQKTKG